jgi:hypothetical protein
VKRRLAAILSSVLLGIAPVLVDASPAKAIASVCRVLYQQRGWSAQPCIESGIVEQDANGKWYYAVKGWALVYAKPAACYRYAVYLVNESGADVVSTSRRVCTQVNSPDVIAWNGAFDYRPAKARLRAWNSSGTEILNILSPFLATTGT